MISSKKMLQEGGVAGLYDLSGKDVCQKLYYSLLALQHRGQTGCGITLNDNRVLKEKKGKGMVGEVLDGVYFSGNLGVGHVRYGEKPESSLDTLPLTLRYIKGTITLSLGGKINNSDKLKSQIEAEGGIFQTGNDAEILSHLIAIERTKTGSIEQSVLNVTKRIDGAFALIVSSPTKLMAYRDKNGHKPLSIGQSGSLYIAASEDSAFLAIGATKIRDIRPGELVMIDKDGFKSFWQGEEVAPKTCAYEYLYFARPDSVIDGINVYQTRINIGRELFKSCPAFGDLVIGMPSSGLHFALGFAWESGIPFGDAIIRNYYLASTHNHESLERDDSLSVKLSVVKNAILGKDLILVDSSLISGTTAKRMIARLRENGAGKIHLRIACPRFLNKCAYTDSIGTSLSKKGLADILALTGADSVGFLPVDKLYDAGLSKTCCTNCFLGEP